MEGCNAAMQRSHSATALPAMQHSAAPPQKFYAVRVGRTPGIYSTWLQCKEQTHGFKRAVFKSFQTREDAEAFLLRIPTPARDAADVEHIRLYVDGSCPSNVGSAKTQGQAGWGIVVLKGSQEQDFYGPVVYDKQAPLFLGATCGTNNTGELSGIAMGLKWILEADDSRLPCRVFYDSEYAANIAQGFWRAGENVALAEVVQRLLEDVRRRREVLFQPVKGHSGDPWNERADRNAALGAQGQLKLWDKGFFNKRPLPDASECERVLKSQRTDGTTLVSKAPSAATTQGDDLQAVVPMPNARVPEPMLQAFVPKTPASGVPAGDTMDAPVDDTVVPEALSREALASEAPGAATVVPEGLHRLIAMGFREDHSLMALRQASSIESAVELLLSCTFATSTKRVEANSFFTPAEVVVID